VSTIQAHPLGASYLDSSQLLLFLTTAEGNFPDVYADGKGIATVGIGVNIRQPGYLALVLQQQLDCRRGWWPFSGCSPIGFGPDRRCSESMVCMCSRLQYSWSSMMHCLILVRNRW
jgi:hypothetical protein